MKLALIVCFGALLCLCYVRAFQEESRNAMFERQINFVNGKIHGLMEKIRSSSGESKTKLERQLVRNRDRLRRIIGNQRSQD